MLFRSHRTGLLPRRSEKLKRQVANTVSSLFKEVTDFSVGGRGIFLSPPLPGGDLGEKEVHRKIILVAQ